ncbi:DNA/RNA nuclease SfsA [Anaerovorax odorimutans]|uniref:DNA/RNA nuclease SfsA n=1 Tax=Anaerovorax odorimutans TaxID=109327 RepID=UPI0003F9903D|nr:DNA/RNA nuclease SfsA [Anaerovorax odorimutans]
MKYNKIVKGTFISRPNRFLAKVLIDTKVHVVHVKNTGRCRELLIEGATVYLEDFKDNLRNRKTRFSLVAVEKIIVRNGKEKVLLVNMDSQITNKVAGEAFENGAIILPNFDKGYYNIRTEKTFGDSRFDFYIEGARKDRNSKEEEQIRAYVEIKSCTLEENGCAKFPDAPTQRGVKHIRELCGAVKKGYLAYVIFIIQMKEVSNFKPNDVLHPEFGIALREAQKYGVNILAYDCINTEDSIRVDKPVKVIL